MSDISDTSRQRSSTDNESADGYGRAVRLARYGGREVLEIVEVEVTDPGPGRVVVAVRAAGINPGEASIREGYLESMFHTDFPSGQGSDLAGVVTQVGEGVATLVVGDEVLGWSDERRAHADYAEVPADQLIRKPSEVSWEVAGSLFVVASTATAAVTAVGAGAGDLVVVSAAAGGVGTMTVQLLGLRGAEVIGIASQANHDWLRSMKVTPVAYGDGLADRIRAHAPDGVDAFIDLYGPEYLDLAVELGVAPDRTDTIISFEKAAETGAKTEGSAAASTAATLLEVVDLVAGGLITVPVAATYPLARVQDAYAELEAGHTHGKIVLIP